MITLGDYFGKMTRLLGEQPSEEIKANATRLLERVNALLQFLRPNGETPGVNSGWRTPTYNAGVERASKTSRHMTGEAVDLDDDDGALDQALFDDWEANKAGSPELSLLVAFDLYMEHPLATKGWCHLQSTPPRSGNRVFFP